MRDIGFLVAMLVVVGGFALVGFNVQGARADDSVVAASTPVRGYDISWPQCKTGVPTQPLSFAVLGVTGGRPFTSNPCYSEQYRWAETVEAHPAVYLNTDYPKPGRTEGSTGPWGTCATGDEWCRTYNYGYATAKHAVERATALHTTPSMWWLDVETENYWSSDTFNNAQVIRGAVDYLKDANLPFGIYGTPFQWKTIAGTFTVPGVPIWGAGAKDGDEAIRRCEQLSRYSFAGGRLRMVQYIEGSFDVNHLCPGAPAPVAVTPVVTPVVPSATPPASPTTEPTRPASTATPKCTTTACRTASDSVAHPFVAALAPAFDEAAGKAKAAGCTITWCEPPGGTIPQNGSTIFRSLSSWGAPAPPAPQTTKITVPVASDGR